MAAGWVPGACLVGMAMLLAAEATADVPSDRGAASSTERAMALRCARQDLEFLTLIDDLSETGEATDDQLVVAAFLRREANAACLARDYSAAFAIFDAISLPPATLSLLEDLRAAQWLAADRPARRLPVGVGLE